ncbi:MAG: HD domain-containing protein, partial [Gammaproteobacteria bacterium]|nr:HD domain-containing protein [Gammaproteobacteria bacterium]
MFRSIKVQIGTALTIQFIVLVVIVSTTLYLLNLRKHDYLILNLSGQLRVISQLIVNHSANYADNAPRDYKSYDRDVTVYQKQLKTLVERYDKIIDSFKARELAPELFENEFLLISQTKKSIPKITEQADPIYCNWNKTARNELVQASKLWEDFKRGLYKEFGKNLKEPRLEAAAHYVLYNEDSLLLSATQLTAAFRNMMEQKLSQITWLNRMSIILSFLIAITIFIVVYKKIFKPMSLTIEAFQRVSQGELNHQVEVSDTEELGKLTYSFNRLSNRINSLFGLTDRIYQATSLDEIIRFIYEEFNDLLPIDWVAMLSIDVSQQKMVVGHIYSEKEQLLNEGDSVSIYHPVIQEVFNENKVISFDYLPEELKKYNDEDGFFINLSRMNLNSMIVYPLSISGDERALLVFATHSKNAYHFSHRELLGNITSQVSHAFERTIGMESLVISAVEGLAKLAESRDPETGDHLVRMSLYSYILASELYKSGAYDGELKSSYARHVFHFAPMHDIGKVGIEDDILLKPGKLSDDEWIEMKKHPVIGADVLRRCERQVNKAGYSMFNIGIEIAEGHHEKFDGSGYPYQRKGTEIPLSARIVALADVFDALTSRRPYKEAWPVDKALKLIADESGKHFDPVVVAALN